ncbi:MAG: branched-chain amino acid transaminase [Candidatus Margulisbacteria bacterium]|nr:branched-chain amino acid transaminase [Candidatus Margulisiibacteriota bacterium]
MEKTKLIWKNGKLIPWEEATTHVLTHALHYSTGFFEGMRAYDTPNGVAIFRARDHFQRLLDSAKIYKMKVPYSVEELIDANKHVIRENNIGACYIRPMVYYGYGEMGINPRNNPVDAIIAVWPWGPYLGKEGLSKGIRCKVSSWTRIDGSMLPSLSKCVGNYANSILAKQEALDGGYDEAILLNARGVVAEGPGENIFMVKNNQLITPPISDSVLGGITRDSVLQIAKDLGYAFSISSVSRDELYTADELFFTGTAAEVTPIREVDGREIGSGRRGPITEKIQSTYFNAVKGEDPKYSDWLDLVK